MCAARRRLVNRFACVVPCIEYTSVMAYTVSTYRTGDTFANPVTGTIGRVGEVDDEGFTAHYVIDGLTASAWYAHSENRPTVRRSI